MLRLELSEVLSANTVTAGTSETGSCLFTLFTVSLRAAKLLLPQRKTEAEWT